MGVTRVGGEILVNTATDIHQMNSRIASLTGGGFVVTWEDLSQGIGGATGDADGYAVKAQVFARDGTPVGGEILVNTATEGQQSAPRVTALSNGGFVVDWEDSSGGVGGATGDADGSALKAQVFAAGGARVGGEILVNTATAGNQYEPQVTALSNGGFVVIWTDGSLGVGGATGDTVQSAVKAQVFGADGDPVGGEIRVNTATAGYQASPQVTALSNGGFVVTWDDDSGGLGGAAGDANNTAVKAQMFDASGTPVGGEILVNTATVERQEGPQITALANGGFVVTWDDYSGGVGGGTGDTYWTAVKAQVFDAGGARVGGEIRVNTATERYQEEPRITALANGGFVVTWGDASGGVGGATGDTSGWAVKAQVFAADGTPVGGEILVNTATEGWQREPQITTLANGGFVVTWHDESEGVGGAAGDSSELAVKAQVFTAGGVPVGGEILVNTAWEGHQRAPEIAALDGGGFVVTWEDQSEGVGGATGDPSGMAVKAQVFAVTFDPALAGAGGTVAFTEGAGVASTPVAVAPAITVADADSTLDRAEVSIIGGFQAGDDVLALAAASGVGDIEAAYDAATGVLTLTSAGGAATLAEWQAALRAVTYVNTSDTPDTTDRTLSIVVNDGSTDSAAVTQTVTVASANDPPQGASSTVSTGFGAARVLGAADFGFSDAEGDALLAVRIASLPAAGRLTLGGVPVTAGQSVTAAQLAGGELVFTPSGYGAASFTFQVQDDGGTTGSGVDLDPTPNTLTIDVAAPSPRGVPSVGTQGDDVAVLDDNGTSYSGGGGDDLVQADGGADFVHGNTGADTLHGGAGDDTVHGGQGGDAVYGGDGDDLLFGDKGDDFVHGGRGDDVIDGGDGSDALAGGQGNDVLRGGEGGGRARRRPGRRHIDRRRRPGCVPVRRRQRS